MMLWNHENNKLIEYRQGIPHPYRSLRHPFEGWGEGI
jgi:hypothetical protein